MKSFKGPERPWTSLASPSTPPVLPSHTPNLVVFALLNDYFAFFYLFGMISVQVEEFPGHFKCSLLPHAPHLSFLFHFCTNFDRLIYLITCLFTLLQHSPHHHHAQNINSMRTGLFLIDVVSESRMICRT